jgi:hypothetical protein
VILEVIEGLVGEPCGHALLFVSMSILESQVPDFPMFSNRRETSSNRRETSSETIVEDHAPK